MVGDKRYELANHLGNVLVVINDKKIPEFNILDTPDSGLKAFNADVLTYPDYYPFGMIIDARHRSKTDYRYGFQGQEMDNEIKGEGNSLNYTFRMHDPRVGRFFATDPLEPYYPFFSPYQFSANTPIMAIELEGLESSNDPNQNQKPTTNSSDYFENKDGSLITTLDEVIIKATKSTSIKSHQLPEIIIKISKNNKSNMNNNFERYQKLLLRHEGGYVNDPVDPGGATNKGIIFSNFKAWAKSDLGIEPTLGNLKNLTDEQANILYKEHYWDKIRGDEFQNGSVAFALYDWSVTSGKAVKEFEKSYAALYNGITVDGKLNSNEISALNKVNSKDIFNLVNKTRLDYYDLLIDKSIKNYKKKNPSATDKELESRTLLKYKKGWAKRVNGIKFEE